MIVTIDGPAGAGKSSVSKLLAARLGFQFLDTGAMYRAVTWAAITRQIPLDDNSALSELAATISIRFQDLEVLVDGINATQEIREPNVTQNVGKIADNPHVRQHLVMMQRKIAQDGNFVCEGRDQGTIVFPAAFCKIFLTASPKIRARRRADQLRAAGRPVDEEQLLNEQNIRDQQDRDRIVGRLVPAKDAIEFDSENLPLEEVVDALEKIARAKMADQVQ